MDAQYLYVTNNGGSSLTVVDLRTDSVVQTVALNAKPEGVEVGADGRVLISTEGTSSTDQINSLLSVRPAADRWFAGQRGGIPATAGDALSAATRSPSDGPRRPSAAS